MFHGKMNTYKCWNKRFAGKDAGTITQYGYVQVRICSTSYLAHKLAFLYMNGGWPATQIDHINHNRADNSWSNLRDVTGFANHRNTSLSKSNSSGHVGVAWCQRRNRWRARISIIGKDISLGYFREKSEAISARESANIKYGFHANHGKVLA